MKRNTFTELLIKQALLTYSRPSRFELCPKEFPTCEWL